MKLSNIKNYRPSGFVLLNSIEFNTDIFLSSFQKEWDIEIKNVEFKFEESGMKNLSFWIGNIQFICNMIPFPYPDNQALNDSRLNYFWCDVVEEVSSHKAFIVVTVFGNERINQIETCVIFTKVCNTLMLLPNICAMYMSKQHLIIEPKEYRKTINVIKAAESHGKVFLPTENWIRIGLCKTKNGYSGYTDGLKEFNKLELEIINKNIELKDLYEILDTIIFNMFSNNMNIENGDIIHLDKEVEAIAKKSDGVFSEGETLKIIF